MVYPGVQITVTLQGDLAEHLFLRLERSKAACLELYRQTQQPHAKAKWFDEYMRFEAEAAAFGKAIGCVDEAAADK